jgi:23S rRNA pseudouridine2605 synthase
LQKVLAAAGIGSRRHCEEMIATGRVEVDRKTVTELGTKVDPHSQEIRVDGEVINQARKVYYLIHKPVGVVSTNFDPSGRPRVIDLLPPTNERLFTVGRLDMSSEGLILVTNDGDLANHLAHPRYGVEKTYHVLVAGKPERDVLAKLRKGVHLAEAYVRVVSVRIKSEFKQSTLLEVVLDEGRNREIRRLLAKVGHKVLRLKRVALGPLRLKELPPGEFRRLRGDEVTLLRSVSRHARPRRPEVHEEPITEEPATHQA